MINYVERHENLTFNIQHLYLDTIYSNQSGRSSNFCIVVIFKGITPLLLLNHVLSLENLNFGEHGIASDTAYLLSLLGFGTMHESRVVFVSSINFKDIFKLLR